MKLKDLFFKRESKLNKRIKKAKYIHLMFNDKFNKTFVDFLNIHFNKKEHLILCKRWFKEHAFPEGDNVIEIENFNDITLAKGKNKQIICHSLFDYELIGKLFENKSWLDIAYWMIWSSDLYRAERNEIHDYVKSNFKGYLTVTKSDSEALCERYDVKNKNFHSVGYPLTLDTQSMVENISDKKIKNSIMVNHRSEENTLEIFDVLKKFKDNDIKVHTILSYGNKDCKDKIIEKGKEFFKDNFSYTEEFLPIEKYINFLTEFEIFISGLNQQAALGNILYCLYGKTKIFLRTDITTYKDLTNSGYTIYDVNKIKDLSFEEFMSNPSAQSNLELAKRTFRPEDCKGLWEKVFKDNYKPLKK